MQTKPIFLAGTFLGSLGALALATSAIAQQDLAGGARSLTGDRVEVSNFIGRIEIREGRGDAVSVEIENAGGLVGDPTVRSANAVVSIDGGQSIRNLNCRTRNDRMEIGRRGERRRSIDEYPRLIITAPTSIAFHLEDSAGIGEAGDLGALDLEISSCGDFEAGRIATTAGVRINGSGDVELSSIGQDAIIDINGSGDVRVGGIGGSASIDIAGSGDVELADIGGNVDVDINGSGDVRLGDIRGLEVNVSGSGDVEADRMNGAFAARIAGSGDIRVGGGQAQPFQASINGSGDIDFNGTATDVTVRESGGGDIHIREVRGTVDWRRNGRTIRIGGAD
ncbi:GIN domain-containing protein [Maricaulis sp. CAU 1757]